MSANGSLTHGGILHSPRASQVPCNVKTYVVPVFGGWEFSIDVPYWIPIGSPGEGESAARVEGESAIRKLGPD